MYPNGNKVFNVEMSGIKLFLHPYFYLMLDHFFREGMPVYDMKSEEKPNEYDDDYEEYPEMDLKFKMDNSLICLAETEGGATSMLSSLGIVCQASIEYDFRRERIKYVRGKLWDKV